MGARWAGEPVVIEPDGDENESHDEGACATFEAIETEDHKAYIEALWFGVGLVRSSLTFFGSSAKTYYL